MRKRRLLKKFIKLITPPVLDPKNNKNKIQDFVSELFFFEKKKNYINYENSFFKRHAFINKAVLKFKNCKYLEIGVDDSDVFDSVPLPINQKFGVDPIKGGNFRITSNDFFRKYKHLKFDVIFIDGLHHYKQCQIDIINSLKCLKKNGIIFIHDLLPRNELEEKVPRKQDCWTGDVWKVAVELQYSKNIDFKIINIDMGLGVLKFKDGFKYKKNKSLNKKNFKDYLKYYKNFPIISCEEGFNFIK